MDLRFDDLIGLTCFARVVEHRSFTRAAAELGVSKSVVSAKVAALERRLGERLLLRTTRALTVTDAGLHVYGRAVAMLESARAATRGASDVERGVIRVSAPFAFAQLYLAAPLERFLAAHPDVRVELTLSDRLVDLVEERVDLAIRVTRPKDSSLVARRLATTGFRIVAAPGYLERRGTPTRPEELLRHNCLRYSLLRMDEEWRLYGPKGRVPTPVTGNFETSSGVMLREAAIAGVGLALLPTFLVADALASGRLVPVLAEYAPRPMGIFAVQVDRRVQPARMKALVELLARELGGKGWS